MAQAEPIGVFGGTDMGKEVNHQLKKKQEQSKPGVDENPLGYYEESQPKNRANPQESKSQFGLYSQDRDLSNSEIIHIKGFFSFKPNSE